MFGRQVVAVLHGSINARLTRSTLISLPIRLSARVVPSTYRRSYATPGRPKKAVGEAGKPIKRASKKSSTTGASKPKAKNAAAKKKPVVKKAKKAKKELTPEQAEKAKERASRLAIRELKKAALEPPVLTPANPYGVFAQSKKSSLNGLKGSSIATIRQSLGDHARQVAASWKALSPEEHEHFNHVANQRKRESAIAYKQWVESHTVEQIRAANHARLALRRKATNVAGKKGWPLIEDERVPKRAANKYAAFVRERHASGDFRHIAASEAAKLIAKEWKELSASEKQRYENAQAQDSTVSYEGGSQATAASATA